MNEIGQITKTNGKTATVRIDKKDECSKCGMCLFPKNANHIDLEALNPIGAKEGDSVEVVRNEGGKLLSALLVFLIPLLLIIGSVIATYLTKKDEIWILILSAISVVAWFIILSFIDKKIKSKFVNKTEIIKIIEK